MSSTDERIVFRVQKKTLAAIDEAAAKSNLSRSEWIRRSLEASVTWDWVARSHPTTVRARLQSDQSGLGMQVLLPSGGCLHPPVAHEQVGPFRIICGLCGVTLKNS